MNTKIPRIIEDARIYIRNILSEPNSELQYLKKEIEDFLKKYPSHSLVVYSVFVEFIKTNNKDFNTLPNKLSIHTSQVEIRFDLLFWLNLKLQEFGISNEYNEMIQSEDEFKLYTGMFKGFILAFGDEEDYNKNKEQIINKIEEILREVPPIELQLGFYNLNITINTFLLRYIIGLILNQRDKNGLNNLEISIDDLPIEYFNDNINDGYNSKTEGYEDYFNKFKADNNFMEIKEELNKITVYEEFTEAILYNLSMLKSNPEKVSTLISVMSSLPNLYVWTKYGKVGNSNIQLIYKFVFDLIEELLVEIKTKSIDSKQTENFLLEEQKYYNDASANWKGEPKEAADVLRLLIENDWIEIKGRNKEAFYSKFYDLFDFKSKISAKTFIDYMNKDRDSVFAEDYSSPITKIRHRIS